MRQLCEYIYDTAEDKVLNEGLISWLKAFIRKVKNNQYKLFQNGKVNMLKMDTNKLQYQKEPAALVDLAKDEYTKEIWSNTNIGFPQSAEIMKNMKKYCPDLTTGSETVKSNPYVFTFYYKSEDTYYAGVIIYEKDIQYIENYLHILSLEVNKVVDNPTDVQKAMFKQFQDLMKNTNKSLAGYTGKDTTGKNVILGALKNIGFKQSDDNDELYKFDK